jgi:DNA invertase Pin-like site-specific DNA recombinase
LLRELRSGDIDLYLHQQALDTSTPSGRMLFGMLSVFSEFERAMIRDRVMAGLDRARSSGKRLDRPRTTPFTVQRIRLALGEGRGVRETARLLKVSASRSAKSGGYRWPLLVWAFDLAVRVLVRAGLDRARSSGNR